MGHTRRIAKGGAATPDIFQDPFKNNQPPPGHESFTKENSETLKSILKEYKNINKDSESFPEFYKRIFKHFYLKWKKTIPAPDPLDGTLQITENELKEMQEYVYQQERNQPLKSRNTIIKEFLTNIFNKEKFDDIKEEVLKIEGQGNTLSTGKKATGQGEPYRLLQIFMTSLNDIDSVEELPYDRTVSARFLLEKGKGEAVDSTDALLYDSVVNLSLDSHSPHHKESKEMFLKQSKILFKENTTIGSILSRISGNIIPLPAVYLIEKEYMKAAWNDNSISSFSKNIGYYMRQSGDGLELWNQSKWISLGDMSSLETIYLWHERFLILDKTPFEYINLLDIESQEKETDEEKQKFFEETKAAIEDIVSSENKREALETIRTKLRRRQFLLKTYESIKDQKILLMDPETMAFLYIQTPFLWEATGFKLYDKGVPEQNIKMIMLLQYVRILSDFQKKKTNKFSAVKGYQGIGLLKDSLQDKKIQDQVLEILKSGEAWNRVLEKQIGLYKGFENPIQTMDQLKTFLADVRKPLEMKAIDLNAEMANTLGSPAVPVPAPKTPVENGEGKNNKSNAGTNISNISIEVDGSNAGSEISNLTNEEESKEEESNEEENNESNAPAPVAPPAAPPNTSFLSVFKQPSYFDLTTQTFPNLEEDIVDKYSYAKEGKEQLKEESDPVKSPEIETVYSSGNNNDCLIHSFLTNISPAFRRLKQEDKNKYASYYRREVLPTFYKDKDEEAKKQMLYQKVYLDESHAFKLSNIFRVNILFMQAVERNAFKNGKLETEKRIAPVILNKEKEEEYKNRPWYVIYNPDNQHFRGMRHTEKSRGFIFTRKDIDTLIKNYAFEPDPKAVEAAAAKRQKEREERNLAKALAESTKLKGGTRTTRKKNRS